MILHSSKFGVLSCSVALLVVLFAGVPAWGQAEAPSGTIVGTVTDSTGALIPNATVTATDTGTGISHSSKTNETGNYSIPLLQVGSYSVAVEANGFRRFVASGLSLSASSTMRVDAVAAGEVSQSVQVSASSVPLLQTDTSTVSATGEHASRKSSAQRPQLYQSRAHYSGCKRRQPDSARERHAAG